MVSMFVVHDPVKVEYAGLYVLKTMEEGEEVFPTKLRGDQLPLAPIFESLLSRKYVTITTAGFYEPTKQGLDVLHVFVDRYRDFLKDYDIFCGVNLTSGDFALKHISPQASAEEWNEFLNEEKWDDLRIAIAEYRGLDAVEIVFSSFMHDQRFGRDEKGWSSELLVGYIWDEIQSICNSAIRLSALSYEKDGIKVAGETVIQTIIQQGWDAMAEWRKP